MKCKICDSDFTPRNSYHFCCSKACSQINQKRLEKSWQERNPDYWDKDKQGLLDFTCHICGTQFQSLFPEAKYCSDSCQNKAAYQRLKPKRIRNKYKLICAECSIEFEGRLNKKYCSKHCENKARYGRLPKKEPKNLVPKTCVECNQEFMPKSFQQKYCSRKCEGRNYRRRYPKPKSLKKGCVGKTDTIVKLNKRIRKSRMKPNTPKWVNKHQLLSWFMNRPDGMEIDHIIPINGKSISGLNVPWNLQYLSSDENNLKSNQFDGTYENDSWRYAASVLKDTREKD
jgi:hypothetical protein